MIRLIATDLDGTLLDAASDVTARTCAAVRAAMEAGVMVSLSSGRMPESMIPFAERLGVNAPMILFNGAMIYAHRDGRTLFENAIPADVARDVARMLEEMGIYVQVYPGKGYYCCRRCEYTDQYEASIRVTATELGTPVSGWMQGTMIKMLAIAPPDKLDAAKPELERAFPAGVHFMKSRPHYMEIVAEGIDKLGVAREEIMAFGDGQNDATMIASAGTGVAMENAVAECRSAAQLIAPRNTEDGVAQIIERYLAEGRMGRS